MTQPVYSVSWNLTQRCNLHCAHCYMSAFAGADTSGELSTAECRRVIDEIAVANPNVFLILTGGEPLLRKDLFDLAACSADKGFTVVLGTNGVLLREAQARQMRQSGIQGASISLDSTDPQRHDTFRHLPGAWQGAVRATEALRAEGLDFSIHTSITDWNVGEIPRMVDLARELGARVLNFFFLVRTGRGEGITDITPQQYEHILTYLARMQGLGTDEGDGPEVPKAIPNNAEWGGQGSWNHEEGFTWKAHLADRAEGGSHRDEYEIWVWDSGGNLVYSQTAADDLVITGGNFQIHPPNGGHPYLGGECTSAPGCPRE